MEKTATRVGGVAGDAQANQSGTSPPRRRQRIDQRPFVEFVDSLPMAQAIEKQRNTILAPWFTRL